MFDARSILEGLVRGAGPAPGASRSGTDDQAPDIAGGLGDLLGQFLGARDDADHATGQARSSGADGAPGVGGLLDMVGQVLGQATDGVREGADKIGTATGASDALSRVTGGQGAEDMVNRLRDFIRDNPIAAGTAAAGIGGLVFGTRTGRSLASGAAQAGALALIGGLAYKAMQNYQAGKPLISRDATFEPAPTGTGFEPDAISNDDAMLYIRAMIAAAAADGRIDSSEQQRIIGALGKSGLDKEAEAFLAGLLNNPPSVGELAAAVSDQQHAAQVYTAARISIDVDDNREIQFLKELAAALKLDPALAAQIDAATQAAAN